MTTTDELRVQINADARRFNEAMERIVARVMRTYADAAEAVAPPPKESTMTDLSLAGLIARDRELSADAARFEQGANVTYDVCFGVIRALDAANGLMLGTASPQIAHARGLIEGATLALRGALGVLPDES